MSEQRCHICRGTWEQCVDNEYCPNGWSNPSPKTEVMSDSVLKQELLAIELKPIPKKYRKETWPDFWHRALTERESQLRVSKAESAALRAEIAKLTLLSDSQLANQERLTEELSNANYQYESYQKAATDAAFALGIAPDPETKEWVNVRAQEAEAELATERANQERLVGEMQEMRGIVKEYRLEHKVVYGCEDGEFCCTCNRADALLAKDTPEEK